MLSVVVLEVLAVVLWVAVIGWSVSVSAPESVVGLLLVLTVEALPEL